MTKLLGFLCLVAAAITVDAKQSILLGDHTIFNGSEVSCYAGDVLSCVRALGHHVYEKEMECPIGEAKFKALFLGTHSTYGRHLDWEPVSYMRFPVPIPVCPTNGFVVAKKEYTKEELEQYNNVIESKTYKELFAQKHATFFLFAKLKELNNEVFDDYWWLYLNATWEADNCKDEIRYKQYALETVSAANKRISEVKDSDEVYWVLKVITAEMYRRIGDFKTSQELVDSFGTPKLKDKETNDYFLLAKKLLQKAIKEKNTDRVPITDEKEKVK